MYIRKNTPIPPFVPLPKFILRSELSINAKLLYGLLLNRATLSQKNCWEDENGGVYVTYTVKEMAEDLDRSERTSQAALSELDAAGLIQRVHQGRIVPIASMYFCRIHRSFLQPRTGSFLLPGTAKSAPRTRRILRLRRRKICPLIRLKNITT